MANVEAFNTDLTEEQLNQAFSRALDDYTDAQIDNMIAGKQDTLTFDNTPTENSSNPVKSGGVYTELVKRLPMTVGAAIVDPDPDNAQYANLFSLPVGKYWRQNNVTRVQNIPAGLTVAFYCIVENTIASNRRRILLYPATSALAGTFYCCVETSGGYGDWYKFEGTVVS